MKENKKKEENEIKVQSYKKLLNFYKIIFEPSFKDVNKTNNTILYDCFFNMFKNKDIVSNEGITFEKITLDDIHAFLSYLTTTYHSKAATRARKASSIRVFFNYLCAKANLIDSNPAQNLETPKLDKRLPKYLSLEDSQKLLEVTENED